MIVARIGRSLEGDVCVAVGCPDLGTVLRGATFTNIARACLLRHVALVAVEGLGAGLVNVNGVERVEYAVDAVFPDVIALDTV